MTERVVLSWVSPGTVNSRFMDSVLRLVMNPARQISVEGYMGLESGPRIASARNTIVAQFLSEPRYKNAEWLMMLDTDITFPPQLVEQLLSHTRNEKGIITRPIVGGLYYGGGHGSVFPLMFEIIDPAKNDGNPIRFINDFTTGDLVEVDATGAGCLLMHRGLLEEMQKRYEGPHHWFAESVQNGKEFGEDWTMCVRVRQMGVPIYVDTGANVGHMKSVEMNEATWRDGQVGLNRVSAPKKEHIAPVIQMPNRQARRAQR